MTRALCKLDGMLVIMETAPSDGGGTCPQCHAGLSLAPAPHGWLECITDGCGFAVLEDHAHCPVCHMRHGAHLVHSHKIHDFIEDWGKALVTEDHPA